MKDTVTIKEFLFQIGEFKGTRYNNMYFWRVVIVIFTVVVQKKVIILIIWNLHI